MKVNKLKKLKLYIKFKIIKFACEILSRFYKFKLEKNSDELVLQRPHNLPKPLIVSLTSYPKRFPTLSLTIKSLLRQTVKSDVIVLWISNDDIEKIPRKVSELQGKGLIIRCCEDIKSYKKLIPSLEEYPDSFIVTCDDDLYYPPNWLDDLISGFEGDFKTAICYRGHRVYTDEIGEPLRYTEWGYEEATTIPSIYNFPTTGAGVLYPPNIFNSTVIDIEKAMKFCPNTDDVWFYWMLLENNAKVKTINKKLMLIEWADTQEEALWKYNVNGNGNDNSINNMIRIYGFKKNVDSKRNS